MTQGIYVNDSRPKSKKAVKEAVAAVSARAAILDERSGQYRVPTVSLQATSFFGNEYDGPITDAPDGFYTFVGPDPERARNYFGNIIISTTNGTRKYVVK